MELEEDRTEQDIKALGDSVTVIDNAIAAGVRDEEALGAVNRNVRHIEIMLAKEHIQASGADLKPFEGAVARGKDFQ